MMRRPACKTSLARIQNARAGKAVGRLLRGARGQRGETLTEVLAAIVIGGLALLMLAMVIATSAHMTMQSRQSMDKYYEYGNQLAAYATQGEGGVAESSGTVSIVDAESKEPVALADSSSTNIGVKVYTSGTDDQPVVAYEATSAVGQGGGS